MIEPHPHRSVLHPFLVEGTLGLKVEVSSTKAVILAGMPHCNHCCETAFFSFLNLFTEKTRGKSSEEKISLNKFSNNSFRSLTITL